MKAPLIEPDVVRDCNEWGYEAALSARTASINVHRRGRNSWTSWWCDFFHELKVVSEAYIREIGHSSLSHNAYASDEGAFASLIARRLLTKFRG